MSERDAIREWAAAYGAACVETLNERDRQAEMKETTNED